MADNNIIVTVTDDNSLKITLSDTGLRGLKGDTGSDATVTTAKVVSVLTAGNNVQIAGDGTVSSTDTQYAVQDGQLSQNSFTNADHSKLNGIEASADVTDTTNVVSALTGGTNIAIANDGTISSSIPTNVVLDTETIDGGTF